MNGFELRSVVTVFTILAAFSAGCSDVAGDDDDDNGPPPVSDANGQQAGSHLGASAESGAKSYKLNTTNAFACQSTSVLLPDTDGDGIPGNVATSYADCSQATAWGLGIVNGTELLTDDEPDSAGFANTLIQDLTIAVGGSSGVMISYEAVHTGSGVTGSYAFEDVVDIVTTGSDANGAYTYTEEVVWSTTYAPASTWLPGLALVAGDYTVGGVYQITLASGLGTTVIEAVVETMDVLQIDPSCPTLIVGGSINAIVGDGANAQILDITWTGCDASGTELINPL